MLRASGCCAWAACLPAATGAAGQGVLEVGRLGQLASGGAVASPSPRARVRRHRCEAARARAVPRPLPRACVGADACTSTPHPSYPRARSDCVHRRVHWGGRCLHQNEETPEAVGDGGERTCPLSRDASPITRTFVMKGAYQSYYMRWNEYSVPNMNGECNAPRQSCTRERGNNVSRPGAASCVSHSRSSALCARIGPLPSLEFF